ncbi:MAG: four helix bundle protein [Chitinophagaceae bacterium]
MSFDKENIIRSKSFAFGVEIVLLCKALQTNREFVLSKQLLKSGTSIGANVREADNAESKMDFIHKMGIAQKEADETIYWLELLFAIKYIEEKTFNNLSSKAIELIKIIKAIIISTKKTLIINR